MIDRVLELLIVLLVSVLGLSTGFKRFALVIQVVLVVLRVVKWYFDTFPEAKKHRYYKLLTKELERLHIHLGKRHIPRFHGIHHHDTS